MSSKFVLQSSFLLLTLTIAFAGHNTTPPIHSEVPMSASQFVDTIGMNVHLHNADTLYGNFPLISSAIFDLGVRHIRDGLIPTTWEEYYRRHSILAEHGVRCIYITGVDETDEQILRFSKKLSPSIEGLEAPNEYDNAGGPSWGEQLQNFLPRLYALGSSPAFAGKMPIVGPSLTKVNSYLKIQSLNNSFDLANMHNYFGGWNPGTAGWGNNGYGSIQWNIDASEKAWGIKKLFTTETGYTTDLHLPQSVPEDVQALYAPRIFLEQALHGISRTYLYELADGNNNVPAIERSYGILRQDGTRKPAFIAIQRLIHLLADSDQTTTAHPVELNLTPIPPELHHLLFQKKDGSLYLAFWLEISAFDQNARHEIAVHSIPFTLYIHVSNSQMSLFSLDPQKNPSGTPVVADGNQEILLTASDAVSILRFSPSS